MRFHLPASAAALVVVCLTAGTAAKAPQGQRPTFRAGIDIVQIDVTVLGPDGKPVHGLARDEFTLLEDGEVQEILGFGEINIPDATEGPAWLKDASPDVRAADDGRVLIFLLDDAQTPDDLRSAERLETVKRIAAEVIDRMGPTDVAAVVCTFDTRCAQDFTNDRSLLRAAVGRFTPKRFPLGFPYEWDRQSSGVAGSLIKYLIEQPGRRKAIIYVTPNQPTRPLVWPPVASSTDGGAEANMRRNVTQQQMIRTFETAMRASVTVFGIDPSGLSDLLGGASGRAGGGRRPDAGRLLSFTSAPRSLSAETGGFSIRDPSQFAEGVAQIFRETGSYYLLGYEQPLKKDTGYNMLEGLRSIEVRVNRPGLVIKTHRGYIAPKPVKPVMNPPSPAAAALAGVLPTADLPLRIAVAPFAAPAAPHGKASTSVAIVLGVSEPAPAERTLDLLDIQVRAFTQHGEPRGKATQQVSVAVPSRRDDEVMVDVLAQLPLEPGVYALRLSASSERLRKAGSVYTDVEVPDFARAPLSLSGVLLHAVPGLGVTPADALASLVPFPPTTLRDFGVAHRVSAFLRVYQGGKGAAAPVTVRATVLDASNQVVAEATSTLAASQFGASRSADYEYQLPLARASPGLHLVRFEAATGLATAHRDVRFTVR